MNTSEMTKLSISSIPHVALHFMGVIGQDDLDNYHLPHPKGLLIVNTGNHWVVIYQPLKGSISNISINTLEDPPRVSQSTCSPHLVICEHVFRICS